MGRGFITDFQGGESAAHHAVSAPLLADVKRVVGFAYAVVHVAGLVVFRDSEGHGHLDLEVQATYRRLRNRKAQLFGERQGSLGVGFRRVEQRQIHILAWAELEAFRLFKMPGNRVFGYRLVSEKLAAAGIHGVSLPETRAASALLAAGGLR